MEIPKNNADYRCREYWDTRFQAEESYDWFSGYSTFRHLMKRNIETSCTILMLGCGNSPLSEEMYRDGYKHITNVDFSPVVIEKMAEKHKDLAEMTWVVGDITDLKFDPSSFDIVIEKGTLDSLMVHERDPWNTSLETLDVMDTILNQISTVLKPNGKFISITFAQPHFRRPLYACARYCWSIDISTIGNTFHFFFCVMTKGRQLGKEDIRKELERERKKLEIIEDKPIAYLPEDNEDFLCCIDIEVFC